MAERPTWALVVTAKGPSVLVKSFIAHHLRLGADGIYIFFDDPLDPTFDLVAHLPRVAAVRCTDSYWKQACGERPPAVVQRQVANARVAQSNCSKLWLAHLDIDEFLFTRNSVHFMLADIPLVADAVRLDVCENMSRSMPHSFGDVFQGPFRKTLPAGVDGEVAAALLYGKPGTQLSRGMQGHHQGKLFLRAASDGRFRTKSAEYATPRALPGSLGDVVLDERCALRVLPFQQHDTQLLHFFTMGPADWCAKHMKRFDPVVGPSLDPSGLNRWLAFRDALAHSPEAVSAAYRNLNLLSENQTKILESLGALMEARLDLQAAVEALFGPGEHGFSDALPEVPYREMRARLEEFLARQAPDAGPKSAPT